MISSSTFKLSRRAVVPPGVLLIKNAWSSCALFLVMEMRHVLDGVERHVLRTKLHRLCSTEELHVLHHDKCAMPRDRERTLNFLPT